MSWRLIWDVLLWDYQRLQMDKSLSSFDVSVFINGQRYYNFIMAYPSVAWCGLSKPNKNQNVASSSSTWVSKIEVKCDLHGLSLKVDEGFIPAVHNRDNTFDLMNFLRLVVDFEAGHVLPATFPFSANLRDERTASLFRERTWRKAIPTRMLWNGLAWGLVCT